MGLLQVGLFVLLCGAVFRGHPAPFLPPERDTRGPHLQLGRPAVLCARLRSHPCLLGLVGGGDPHRVIGPRTARARARRVVGAGSIAPASDTRRPINGSSRSIAQLGARRRRRGAGDSRQDRAFRDGPVVQGASRHAPGARHGHAAWGSRGGGTPAPQATQRLKSQAVTHDPQLPSPQRAKVGEQPESRRRGRTAGYSPPARRRARTACGRRLMDVRHALRRHSPRIRHSPPAHHQARASTRPWRAGDGHAFFAASSRERWPKSGRRSSTTLLGDTSSRSRPVRGRMRAALSLRPRSVLVSLDGRSAYDSMSQAAFLSKLREVAPELLPFVRLSYGQPSSYCWWDVTGAGRAARRRMRAGRCP